ncbi:MAG: hypothetical protein IJR82_05900 [Bacilli bacterium]|nr:hypothetical protein [Bacilli bacterium]
MINQGDILTLNDNRKYCVVFIAELNFKKYVYLVDQDNYMNTMFCEYGYENDLEEVIDPAIIEQLLTKIF